MSATIDSASYPKNGWYAVAASDEVGPGLLSRRLLGTSVVLYRKRDGAVVAMEDRCSHRHLPLSMGRLVDDQVVCRYHGFTFDGAGTCTFVPSQANVPYGAAVRSFRIQEQHPLVWIWLGNPARSRAVSPPEAPWLADPAWTSFGGSFVIAANYMLLHENALDRTHFAFVHPETSHRGYLDNPPPLIIEVTETSVSYARTFAPGPIASWQAAATGLDTAGHYAQQESGVFVSPALHVDHMAIIGPSQPYKTVFTRAFTPIDSRSTRVHWWVSRDFALTESATSDALRRIHEQTMKEDEPLLEAIQRVVDADGERSVANAASDAAAVRARQIVTRLLDEERPR